MPLHDRSGFETKSTKADGSSIFQVFDNLKVEDSTYEATISTTKALRSFILYSKTKIMNGEGEASEEIFAIKDYLPKVELAFIYYFLDALDKKVFRGTMFKSRAKDVMRLENGILKRFLADEYECYELFQELLSGSNVIKNEIYQGDCSLAGNFFQTVYTEHFDTLGGKDKENADAVVQAASGKGEGDLDASTLYSFIDELIFDKEKAKDIKDNLAKYAEFTDPKNDPIKQIVGMLFTGATLSRIGSTAHEIAGNRKKALEKLCNSPGLKNQGSRVLASLSQAKDGSGTYIIDTKDDAALEDFKSKVIKALGEVAQRYKEQEEGPQIPLETQREKLIRDYANGKISAREFEREDAKLRNEQPLYFQEKSGIDIV